MAVGELVLLGESVPEGEAAVVFEDEEGFCLAGAFELADEFSEAEVEEVFGDKPVLVGFGELGVGGIAPFAEVRVEYHVFLVVVVFAGVDVGVGEAEVVHQAGFDGGFALPLLDILGEASADVDPWVGGAPGDVAFAGGFGGKAVELEESDGAEDAGVDGFVEGVYDP